MERVDTIVVGAGIIGLAVARALSAKGREVLILESESAVGTVTSARNSGVIHAGLYYRPNSLKAKFCVAGRDALYAYAAERGIAHQRCGKLVVATDDSQLEALRALQANAEASGVTALHWLTPAEAHGLEPEISCVAALHVPMTGIVDQHELMMALLGDAEAQGATLVLRSPVERGAIGDGFTLEIGGETPSRIACRVLVNAAGLGAQGLAHHLRGLDPATVPAQVLAKGNYFGFTGKSPFRHLIYPLPEHGSSGLHAGLDLGGKLRFGPDVEWVERIDYRVDPAREPLFAASIRRYWPGLPDGALQPDYAGVRPKLSRTGPHDADFVVQTEREHRVPGLVNLYGIESPGLTSCLALADYVAALA